LIKEDRKPMTRNDFFNELAFLLDEEPSKVNELNDFRANPNYNSLVAIGITAMLEEKIGAKIDIWQLRDLKNVRELMDLVGREKFEE
jgi:acyl carrier protein